VFRMQQLEHDDMEQLQFNKFDIRNILRHIQG
jgi:hypothetical protein